MIQKPNVLQYQALNNLINKKKGIVTMPCGSGKTLVSAILVKKLLLQNPSYRVLFVCHNIDILKQAKKRDYETIFKNTPVTLGFYTAEMNEKTQIVFATAQKLHRHLDEFNKKEFAIIIYDEAHHYQAKNYSKIVSYFEATYTYGFTATPFRMDGRTLHNIGDSIYKADFTDGITNDILSKFEYYFVDNDIDFSNIRWDGHNYSERDFNREICIKEYDEAIYGEFIKAKTMKNRKRFIAFCNTIAHTKRLKKFFTDKGIKCDYLTKYNMLKFDQTKRNTKRTEILDSLRDGDIEILFVRDMLNEGIDIPTVDCILMLRPTKSSIVFQQQLGRGLRIAKEKDYLLVLDFSGNAKKCSISIDVLSKMLNINIKEEVLKKKYNNKIKELKIVSNGSSVRLSKTKIDLIALSENQRTWKVINKNPSKDELIKNYFELKTILCRRPFITDIKKDISKYHESPYITQFGSWKNFLKTIGELNENNIVIPITKRPKIRMVELKKQILNNIYQIKYQTVYNEILKEVPNV